MASSYAEMNDFSFLFSAALSSYVLRENEKTSSIHFFHLLSVIMTFITTAIGFAAGIEMKRSFYSFHSWIGLVTLFLFSVQVESFTLVEIY